MADKALVMGVNRYAKVTPLRGCLNDVANIRDLIVTEFNFSDKHVRPLEDKEVRKSNVQEQMEWLFQGAKPGDRVIFHFSGHGTAIADRDGDDEGGKDELICLQDMDFKDPDSYFVDDELRDWTRLKPEGVHLLVILDNCHSGTGTRLLAAPSASRTLASKSGEIRIIERATDRRARDRELQLEAMPDEAPQHLVLARYVEPPPRLRPRARRRSAKRSLGRDSMNHVLLAACEDTQTAADAFIGGKYQGAFSYHLGRILRGDGVQVDRGQLLQRLQTAMLQDNFEQTPQLESAVGAGPLFSGGSDAPGGSDLGNRTDASKLDEILTTVRAIAHKLDISDVDSRGTLGKSIVYVHGIGVTDREYSEPWWQSMKPFVPSLLPGIPGEDRFEVFWGDLVNRDLETSEEQADMEAVRELLETSLVERRAASAELSGEMTREIGQRGIFDDIQNFLGLPQIDDFLRYLTSKKTRRQCIGRFTNMVKPVLAEGRDIEIISHSWGTVVAYEGLRELETENLPGRVKNFFTAGAALSMSMVKSRLRRRNRDGAKPSMVKSWTNLDAQGDLVGGSLRANRFEVDNEFLELKPTGCKKGFFGGYNLVCAHSSYFVRDNVKVNQDIFGSFIERT